MGIGQVWVGVRTTEIRLGHAVLNGRFRQAELFDKDRSTVGSGDTVEGVEKDRRLGRGLVKPVLDHVKVEDVLEECKVVRDRVDNGDLEWSVGELARLGDVELISSRQPYRSRPDYCRS